MANEKLEKERKNDKNSTFANPVIGCLMERCREDEGLAQDVMQEHKTWKKCLDYIYEQARKQAVENKAAVRSDIVFEWAEDYYRKDDKAEEEKKAKEKAEAKAAAKARTEKATVEKKTLEKEKTAKTIMDPPPGREQKEGKPKEQARKTSRDMEGQMDMFSMMGM